MLEKKLEAFVNAAKELNQAWEYQQQDGIESGYPKYLPSFDEFYCDLLTWLENAKAETAQGNGVQS